MASAYELTDKKKEAIKRWLEAAARVNVRPWLDAHFDSLFGVRGFPRDERLLEFSCAALLKASDIARLIPDFAPIRTVSVFLPFEGAHKKLSWRNADWARIEGVSQPPNLMLLEEGFGITVLEQYYKRLDLPDSSTDNRIRAYFRSWSNTGFHTNDFTTGVYLDITLQQKSKYR